ncbi:MAG TPA: FAD-dependent oxidoreductase, partial [Candidatus Eisenbacteria bacterium]|nr:FAD-dependent oxidoreductase [Candidatus Eisenbacteria bacterium]
MPDVIVVGAGLAGLSAARELAGLGLAVRVVEREQTPGGRCATRLLDGQPMDPGCAFLHGRTPDFIAVLEAVPGRALWGWPRRGDGPGAPCQPDALEPPQKRVAFEQGLDRLPRHLAAGLDVRFGCEVSALAEVSGGIACRLTDGGEDLAKCVVLTAPLPEARRLLGTLTPRPAALARVTPLLDLVTTEPCAVALARYPADAPVPEWDVSLPEWGALATLVHDSS